MSTVLLATAKLRLVHWIARWKSVICLHCSSVQWRCALHHCIHSAHTQTGTKHKWHPTSWLFLYPDGIFAKTKLCISSEDMFEAAYLLLCAPCDTDSFRQCPSSPKAFWISCAKTAQETSSRLNTEWDTPRNFLVIYQSGSEHYGDSTSPRMLWTNRDVEMEDHLSYGSHAFVNLEQNPVKE